MITACASGPTPERLKAELETMYDSDQNLRMKIQEVVVRNGATSAEFIEMVKEQQRIDEVNLRRLDAIVTEGGWPALSVVGEKASVGAFLIVQHADLSAQKRYLPVLRAAVMAGEAQAQDLALLEDRVLMREGKKQRYGSQLEADGKGGWRFYPIENERSVDERRKSVGLPPLADYAKQFGFEYEPR